MNFAGMYRAGILLLAIATPTIAQADNRWYAGAAYSRVSGEFVDMSYGSRIGYGPQPSENGFRIIGGLRPLEWLAIEANYADFGDTEGTLGFVCVTSPCPIHFNADAKAFSVSTQALYGLGPVDLFAKLGVARWSADYAWINDDGSPFRDIDRDGTDAVWGGGLQFNVRNITTRVEYERFDLAEDSVENLSLGVTWSFR
jgi:outer membrane protein with beta-barrel domain